MAHILDVDEAATVLRCEADDPLMLQLLGPVDAYIEQATGRDWTADDPIRQEAKSAAQMLLVMWHESPGGSGSATLSHGLTATLVQLEALALKLESA